MGKGWKMRIIALVMRFTGLGYLWLIAVQGLRVERLGEQ